ncbi:hypothetical protein SFC07_11000 [Corynebacterium callunae]|uniref:hypothetical protein n=1 Tax=Corynebacterium callunae TaxID=1721 RepID=UPI00398233EB
MADLSHIGGEIPDSAYVADGSGDSNVKTLQGMDEDSVKQAMRGGIDESYGGAWGQLFNGLLKGIGGIIGGAFGLGVGALQFIVDGITGLIGGVADGIRRQLPGGNPWTPISEAFIDRQNELKERYDLIPIGYCSAYMDRNINLEWSRGERRLPFRAALGPSKGAHLDVDMERIVFDVTGTWSIHVRASYNGTIYTGDGRVHIDIFVRRANGDLHSTWRVRDAPGTEEGTLTCTEPVVIDEVGMTVDVVCRSGNWRWWPGGKQYSCLAVVRAALETDNPGVNTVPDEEAPA